MQPLRIAVVGATGAVGREILKILDERSFPAQRVVALASDRSVGSEVSFGDSTLRVDKLDSANPRDYDLAFFATSSELSKSVAPTWANSGAWVIDLSSQFRMCPDTPLLVPEVNPEALNYASQHRIIANPNCVAAPLTVALKPLRDAFGLVRVVVSSYQSVSGRGQKAMDELFQQSRAIFVNDTLRKEEFDKQIAFNLIPQIDDVLPNGFTGEEQKVHDETQKILGCRVDVAATCVRVPVFIGHCMTVAVELERDAPLAEVRKALANMPGLAITRSDEVITPIECAGEDAVFLSRLRRDPTVSHGVLFWLASDNLRKGAALNAVQIAEQLQNHPSFQPR